MICSLQIFGILLLSITEVHGLSKFPENFVLGKDSKDVKLTCNTTADKNITWKYNNEALEEEIFPSNFKQDGQHLTLSEVDSQMLGEYTCWSEGQMLSSVYLLQEVKGLDSLFTCWAKSYDCNFSCMWTNNNYTAVRVGLGKDCTEGLKSCQWVTRNGPMPSGGFQFEFSHSLSPFTEENTMMEVTAEAFKNLSIVRKTKTFFLRDIIRPDSPRIVKCESMGQNLKLSIEPPVNWSTPHSFFSLEHQIEYKLRDDGQVKRSSSPLIPNLISELRVRSRDSLVLSTWSEWKNVQWSDWKNGTC